MNRKHSYGWFNHLILFIFVVILFGIDIFAILILLANIFQLITGSPIDWMVIPAILFWIMLVTLFLLLFSNIYPSIQISKIGLNVQFCFFWWLFVPWENILDIRPTLTSLRGTTVIVVVYKLTPIHRIFGLIWGVTFYPTFLIKRSISDYDKLVHTIKQQVSKELL